MSSLKKWISAALLVAEAEGMANEEVIPTWPADCVERFPDRFPQLTVGALREWQASAVVPKDDLLLQDVANKICEHLPEGFELRLCMENGAAWIELSDDHGNGRTLPEIDDVCVAVQLNNALCVACGWTEREQES
jgi:hypothetical protein